jgi:hypothetical protein
MTALDRCQFQAAAADIKHGEALVTQVKITQGRLGSQGRLFLTGDNTDLHAEDILPLLDQGWSIGGVAHRAGGHNFQGRHLEAVHQLAHAQQCLAGALGTLLDSISTVISTPTFTGTAHSAVYDGPEDGTNLNFYYQFANTGGEGLTSLDAIARMSAGGFSDWATDVSQSSDAFGSFVAGTVAANTVDRGTGVLGFNFTPGGVLPGQSTNIIEVRTDATDYTSNWMAVIDGTAGFAPAFAPTAAIPEPETYALMLAGLGLLGFVGRRRMNRDKPANEADGKPADA